LVGSQVANLPGVGLLEEEVGFCYDDTAASLKIFYSATSEQSEGLIGMCHGLDFVSQCVVSTRRARISLAVRYRRCASALEAGTILRKPFCDDLWAEHEML
jgi:hypothetical protein